MKLKKMAKKYGLTFGLKPSLIVCTQRRPSMPRKEPNASWQLWPVESKSSSIAKQARLTTHRAKQLAIHRTPSAYRDGAHAWMLSRRIRTLVDRLKLNPPSKTSAKKTMSMQIFENIGHGSNQACYWPLVTSLAKRPQTNCPSDAGT